MNLSHPSTSPMSQLSHAKSQLLNSKLIYLVFHVFYVQCYCSVVEIEHFYQSSWFIRCWGDGGRIYREHFGLEFEGFKDCLIFQISITFQEISPSLIPHSTPTPFAQNPNSTPSKIPQVCTFLFSKTIKCTFGFFSFFYF